MGFGLLIWLVFLVLAVVLLVAGVIMIYLGVRGKTKQGWIAAAIGLSFVCLTVFGIAAMLGFLFGWG